MNIFKLVFNTQEEIEIAITEFLHSDKARQILLELFVRLKLDEEMKAAIAFVKREFIHYLEMEILEYLHAMFKEEVRNFITSNPIHSELSNRQLAAVNGILIREVKRRRRRGYFDRHDYGQ